MSKVDAVHSSKQKQKYLVSGLKQPPRMVLFCYIHGNVLIH